MFEDIARKWMTYAFAAWQGMNDGQGPANEAIRGLIYRTRMHHKELSLWALTVQASIEAANEWEMTRP